MSVLDTFFLLFEGDATGAKKASEETEKASEKTAEAVVKHGEKMKHAAEEGVEANSKWAESFDKVREHAHEGLLGVLEQVAEATLAFQGLIKLEELVKSVFEQAEASDKLGETARQLGVNVEQLDQWGQAVKRVGGTAEGFEGSLKAVEFRLQRISLAAAEGKEGGDRSSRFFKALGISPEDTKDIFHLLEEIPRKIEGMDKGKSNALLRGIGLDDGTIRLLQSGSKEVEELIEKQKRLGSITAEDTEIAERFNREWMDVKELFRNLTVSADSELLPSLQSLLSSFERFVEFLRDHADLVKGTLAAMGAAALVAAGAFGVLGTVMGVVFSPIVGIVAAVAAVGVAIGFLYDDIMAFEAGNASVTGEMAKTWPAFGEAVHGTVNVIRNAKNAWIAHLWDMLEWAEKIPQGFKQWGGIIGGYIDEAKPYVSGFVKFVTDEFNLLPDPIKEVFKRVLDIVKDYFGQMTAAFPAWLRTFMDGFHPAVESLKAGGKFVADVVVDPHNAVGNYKSKIDKINADFVKLHPEFANAFETTRDPRARSPLAIGMDHLQAKAASTPEPFDMLTGHADAAAGIAAGQNLLAATQSPLLAIPPGSLGGSNTTTGDRNISISSPVSVTINTTNGDPAAIQMQLETHLEDHYKSVLSTFADGVTH